MHYCQTRRHDDFRPLAGYPLYEVISSGVGLWDPSDERGKRFENSYALLEFDTTRPGREKVEIRMKRQDGSSRRRSEDGYWQREPLTLKLKNLRRD